VWVTKKREERKQGIKELRNVESNEKKEKED